MKLWKRLILIPGVFVGTLAAFWTVIEVMNFFEHPLAQTIRTWNHGAGLWILLALSALLALLSPQILSESIVSTKMLKPLASAIKWLIRQRRYIFLAVLLTVLELVLYGLAGWKLVAVSFAHLFLVMPTILMLLAPKQVTGGLLEKVDFDYFPTRLPTENWKLAEGPLPEFALADCSGKKALVIQKLGRYALDYDVEPAARLGKSVEFVTKLKSGAAIYAHIDVEGKERSTSERVWIQFRVGTTRRPDEHPADNEWLLYITPKDEFEGGWQLFRENLISATKETFGTEGRSFERLIGFRLRGNLELAYIAVFE